MIGAQKTDWSAIRPGCNAVENGKNALVKLS